MLPLHFRDGRALQVEEVDLRRLQVTPHRVECVVYARTEYDDINEWRRIPVSECSVAVNDPGTPAEVTLTTVAPTTFDYETVDANGDPVKTPYLDSSGQRSELTPWGTWLQVFQYIWLPGTDRPGGDGLWGDDPELLDNPIVVPWGSFVVTDVATENNTQTVQASDALAMLDFRSYVRLTYARVVKGKTNLRSLVDTLLAEAWPAGTDPWANAYPWEPLGLQTPRPISEWSGVPANSLARTTEQYDDTDRLELVRALLARDEFDWASATSDYDLAAVVVANQDTVGPLYLIRREFDVRRPEGHQVRDIKAGQGLVSMRSRKSRDGLVNRAILTWKPESTSTAVVEKQYRTRVDLVAVAADEVAGKVYVGQRFGMQTQHESASGVEVAADAVRKGRRIILRSLLEATEWEVTCSPVYGLQVDDLVSLSDSYGNVGYGRVLGMRVGLTSRDTWSLTVQPTNMLDSRSFGNIATDVLETSYLQWKTIFSSKVAEGMKSRNGWTVSGGTMKFTKNGMTVVAPGASFTLRTDLVYRFNGFGAAKASVEVGTVPEQLQVRVGISDGSSTVWGAWETILRKTSKTVGTDVVEEKGNPTLGVPAIGEPWRVVIEVRHLGSNGAKVDLGGITVEVPGIAEDKPPPAPGGGGGTPGGGGSGRLVFPIAGGRVTTSFGARGTWWSCNKDSSGRGTHTGADISASSGTTVRAIEDGTVRHVTYGGAFGSHQLVLRADSGRTWFFAHMRARIADGTKVSAGDKIGEVGTEGNVTGAHLHLELHKKYVGTTGWYCSLPMDPTTVVGRS